MTQAQSWIASSHRNTFDPLKQRMRRCLGYAGLSNKCADRCYQHFSHALHESSVYGLYTAVLKHRFGMDFRPSQNAFQILYSTRKEDLCLGELIVTILGGFLITEGGLNRIYGGVQPGRPVSDEALRQEMFEENARAIEAAPFQKENIAIAERKQAALMRLQYTKNLGVSGKASREQVNEFLTDVLAMRKQDELLKALRESQELDTAIENLGG